MICTHGIEPTVDWICQQVPAVSKHIRFGLQAIAWERTFDGECIIFIFATQPAAEQFEEFIPRLLPILADGYRQQGNIDLTEIQAAYE
jgi:hypothetical protein